MLQAGFAAVRRVCAFAPAACVLLVLALVVAPAGAKDAGYTHGLMWRIEAAGVAPSYLYGTMHSADPAIATPPPALAEVLQTAGSLAIEAILDDSANAGMAREVLLPESQSLGQIAGPERMRRIVAAGAKYGFSEQVLERFKPWALQMMFSLPPSETRRQAAGEKALDMVLEARARARGIPVYALETPGEQIRILSGAPESAQLVMLDAAIVLNADIESIFGKLKSLYLAGDLAGMDAMMDEMNGGAPQDLLDKYKNRLVRLRNVRMADRMAPLLREGNALIAVGALHLYGPEGIPALLAQRGYRVSRVE